MSQECTFRIQGSAGVRQAFTAAWNLATELLKQADGGYELILRPLKSKRSIEQNRLLHKRLTQLAKDVEWSGQRLSVVVWKRLCTAAWLREAGDAPLLVPALDGHGVDIIYEHTASLSVAQVTELITWIEAFGSENGVKWTAQDLGLEYVV